MRAGGWPIIPWPPPPAGEDAAMETPPEQPPTRIVEAPRSDVPIEPPPPNRILSVRLEEGQAVEWIWSLTPDGAPYVSGYAIVDEVRSA